jgi:ATP-binding protein involved in chromosome partitioning
MAQDDGKKQQEILDLLTQVIDPDLGKNIVDLGFVKDLEIADGKVSFKLELTTPACPMREQFKTRCAELVSSLDWVDDVEVELTASVRGKPAAPGAQPIPGVRNMIAVASGKGGVGKSTVAANLAIALQQAGAGVGLLDADVYGPSVPTMFGVHESPRIEGEGENSRVIPLEKFGIKLMSMGLLAGGDTPVIWRGPMVHNLLTQFLTHVDWGELDYLVVDFPPGTGDAQLTMTQAPLAGAVIVTTPQVVSLLDARKALHMFRKVSIDVLGIVENMSYFACPHCGEQTPIFREGGGEATARELGVSLLGQIPIDPEITLSGDEGVPIVIRNPGSEVSKAYRELAGKVAAELSKKALSTEAQGGNAGNSTA